MKIPALVLWFFLATVLYADKNTDLLYFAAAGKTETVKALLDAKANINTKDDYGWTPLMHAAKYGRVETVRLLLAAKANPSVAVDGETSLHPHHVRRLRQQLRDDDAGITEANPVKCVGTLGHRQQTVDRHAAVDAAAATLKESLSRLLERTKANGPR